MVVIEGSREVDCQANMTVGVTPKRVSEGVSSGEEMQLDDVEEFMSP